MTTIQETITSPFISKIATGLFGVQQQYIDDLLKIKKLMNKTKLGILSEQLFIILKQKYPQEYDCLLMEQTREEAGLKKEEKKSNAENAGTIDKQAPSKNSNEKADQEKEQQMFQHWVNHYGRP